MQIVQAPRASAILYNLLVSRADHRPWLLPANICPIVPLIFYKARITFKLVDISAQTLQIDLELVEELVSTRKYGGLLYAHTYGDSSTPQDFFRRIKDHSPDVLVVDDRCLCIPEADPAQDTNADVCLFSTGYAKIVDLGRGGYAFFKKELNALPTKLPFNSDDYTALERSYKQVLQDRRRFEYHDSNWLETDADLPSWYDYSRRIQDTLTGTLRTRAEINTVYQNRLPHEIQFPSQYQNWRFNIRVKNGRRILEALFAAGLFASSHYASLAGIMTGDRAPNAEKLASEVINLFNDHHFSISRAENACNIILENLS